MRIILLFSIITISIQSVAQYTTRESGLLYTGLSYSLVFFTNPDVYKVYPTFDLNNTGLLSEVNGFIGYKMNKIYAVEFSPSVMFAKTTQDQTAGFWAVRNNQRYWYVPQDASLINVAIDFKARMYPFASNNGNILKDFYFSLGGGVMYLQEQYTNYLYNDSSYNAYVVSVHDDNNEVWAPNLCFSIGFNTGNNFGYGFDIAYRIVPLPVNRNNVLSTSNAGNFNSLNISAKILFNL
jgi:hypothetical protein